MTDTVFVAIIAASASIVSAVVTTGSQYVKEKAFKNKEISRKDLNTLYVLNNEIRLNKSILQSNLNYMKKSGEKEVNFYFTNLIPKNDVWKMIKERDILCIIDDKILTEKLFDFYAFVDQSIVTHKHKNEQINEGKALKDTIVKCIEAVDDISNRLNSKINQLYKK